MGGSSVVIPGLIALGVWLGFAGLVQVVRAWSTRGGDDLGTGTAILLFWLYARGVHRVRFEGLEHVPDGKHPGPLLIVANHTAGIDPVLIQAACRFEIRWMMAEDMRTPGLDLFWRFARIIFVDRRMGDRRAGVDAVRHLREGGGALGVFPEGRIERPSGVVLPFMPGVGVFAKRTGALVLPVYIEGTPFARTAWGSLWRTSRSRVVFLPALRYGKGSMSAREIAEDLRRRIAGAGDRPLEDHPAPLEWREGRYGK